MELLKITDQLYLVPAQNNGRFPFAQSVYVDAERKILFDAGIGPKLLPRFLKEFQVDIHIVSHSHPDHIAGSHLLAGKAPIYVPAESADSFGRLDQLAARFIEGDEATTLWRQLVTRLMGYKDVEANRTFDGRAAFDLGSVKLLALHTPGHLEDHYCFYEEYAGVMLLFDIDLSPFGPFYGHRESDIDRFEASINFVRSYQPELVVSSHMGVLRKNVDGALAAFAARFEEREQRLVEMLREAPRGAAELAATFPFTPRHHPQLRPMFQYWETQMVHKHLDRLVAAGQLNPDGSRFVVR